MTAHISQDQKKECGSQGSRKCEKSCEFSEKACSCKHELSGTGGVFLRSLGIILCNECKGTQQIKRPFK